VASEVEILQGDIQAVITNETLALETNGERSAVEYTVTQAPFAGQLWLDYVPVMQFSQADVDDGRLSYLQSDMTSGSDEFVLDVRDAFNELVDVFVDVVVTARVVVRDDAVAVSGDRPLPITVDVLDAGELAELTGADPRYEVFVLPRYGTLSVAEPARRRRRRSDHGTLAVAEPPSDRRRRRRCHALGRPTFRQETIWRTDLRRNHDSDRNSPIPTDPNQSPNVTVLSPKRRVAGTSAHQSANCRSSQSTRRQRRNDDDEEEMDSSFFEPKLVFSHDDVVNERVSYAVNPAAGADPGDDDGPQNDVFNFTLIAPNTQPAVGSLKLAVTLPPPPAITDAPPPPPDDDG